ncbi:protein SOB FIVE-LIKE 5-like isoform X2 [Solanum dulcamara]|uniref:protein SOB FIVE-LIKE 5-like isoform X2 n=1 Tax=Solanum dulcamara TaxID=45834 RepID=UPI002485315B|nr:protein SOB FIVE-LIKE 5-like isoform X2 [Solanum dulcamara]
MNYGLFADSECSSGCESGWTLYLENSILPPLTCCKANKLEKFVMTEQEEEDLSMVSDASSGPPHFCEEEDYGHSNRGFFSHAPINVTLPKCNPKKQKAKEKLQACALDDTASSPTFGLISNNNFRITNDTASVDNNILDFSQGHSTTHLQRRSTYQEQYGFFQSSLLPGNQLQQNQWFEEKKWGGDSSYHQF